MNRLIIARFWPFALILLLICFTYLYSVKNVQQQKGTQCQLFETQTCVVSIQGLDFSGRLLRTAEVEEEINIELAYPSQYTLQQSYIQGINMYMGQTALINTASSTEDGMTTAKYLFFLGACSERDMRWQLVLLFVNPATLDEKRLFFNFDTHY
ncbi:hypothetical protein [Paraglaciecola sp. L1A13]|uniref:hypothetical protein n=1 Tax=Paraglaciecola sp. L1A13 TaxID=2686359 RepID=UPI001E2E1F83|nr:hypothetical protein [Paraglaciecola sp. L1A13]